MKKLLQTLLIIVFSIVSTACGLFPHKQELPKPPQTSYFIKSLNKEKLIIFVHGIFGDVDSTWYNDVSKKSWPMLLNNDIDFENYDIFLLSYFTPYIGAAPGIAEIANGVRQELFDRHIFKKYKQIFFIAHSMGGLVTKRIIVSLNNPSDINYLKRIRAVLFFAVPSRGAEIAALGNWLKYHDQLSGMDPKGAQDFLISMESDLRRMAKNRSSAYPFPKLFCAYETLPTFRFNIVPSLYAESLCDIDPYALPLDHLSIVKPYDADHQPYLWAKERILENSQEVESSTTSSTAVEFPSGHVVIFDGWKYYDRSGFNFRTGSLVSWNSGKGDLLVANSKEPEHEASFFTQNEIGLYSNALHDQNANGGLIDMQTQRLEDVLECPADGYIPHWFKPQLNNVYCIRTFDGKNFAKIKSY